MQPPSARRQLAIHVRATALSAEDIAKHTSRIGPLPASKSVRFGQAGPGFRTFIYRALGVLATTAALITAGDYLSAPYAGPGPNGSNADVAALDDQIAAKPGGTWLSSVPSTGQQPAQFRVPAFSVDALQLTPDFIAYLKRQEGLRLSVYLDAGGTPTVGYGHTGLMPDGTPVSRGKSITLAEADALLLLDAEAHAKQVRDLLGTTPVTQAQFLALVDFAFNKGAEKLANSTLLKEVLDADYLGASDEFLRWVYVTKRDAKGKVITDERGKPVMEILPGLETRARDNYDMMRSGLPASLIPVLERDRIKASSIARARAVTQGRILPMKISNDWVKSASEANQLKTRVLRHLQHLTEDANRARLMAAEVGKARAAAVERLKAAPGLASASVTQDQINQAMGLIGEVAVLERIQDAYRAKEAQALAEHASYTQQTSIIEETILVVVATKAYSQGNSSDDQASEALRDRISGLMQRWPALTDSNSAAKALVSAADANRLLTGLRGAAKQMDQVDARPAPAPASSQRVGSRPTTL
ncbi:Phage-related lysozyme (muraminidase) [Achromobacter sp. 2789STDY5608633]|uniref:lysozyme n=1 Tax=Achromobacter sp. 2789STDY5608633 TaxID=1806501 RepID=UPI0006C22C19|nr:lysozyme [Achromobacter sp. 2789STDY5608633]CUJ68699.1 Phage-related lysozyme (muraminidase) [Achromobacter sp. 2789STDY5608633]